MRQQQFPQLGSQQEGNDYPRAQSTLRWGCWWVSIFTFQVGPQPENLGNEG